MKPNTRSFLIFLLFAVLLLFHPTSARFLASKPGFREMKVDRVVRADSSTDINEEFSNLMGSEQCREEDEECLKRRMVAEAHLDYIYTQHQKP